jgi:serine protease Do
MSDRGQRARDEQDITGSLSRHTRLIVMLVAISCLSIGVAIGAIVRGVAGARGEEMRATTPSEDNRIAISNSKPTPDSLSAIFARVSDQVEPTVVHIKVSQGEIATREGSGSGVIVNPSGFIITNNHVVNGAARIKVRLIDGTEYDAKVIGRDSGTDLAVIKIDARTPLPASRMGDSDKLNVGDWVLAIGSPFGLEQTVTAGIISAKDRVADSNYQTAFQQFLQTDAAINPGNSGGPLVNMAGEVIGINTQIATATGFNNGIGLALPSATAVDIYNQLVTTGRVRRGFLGIRPVELTPQIARVNKMADRLGVLVKDLTAEDGPAGRAGIQSGDVIVSINGQPVKDVRELIRRIASLPVGSDAAIGYVRNGEKRTASVRLEERREADEEQLNIRQLPFDPHRPRGVPEKEEKKGEKSRPRNGLGIAVETLTGEIARTRGLENARGAYVTAVEPGSVADDQIMIDDLIVEVNYRPVVTRDDFLRLIKELKSGDDVVIKVFRKDRGPVRRAEFISFTMP